MLHLRYVTSLVVLLAVHLAAAAPEPLLRLTTMSGGAFFNTFTPRVNLTDNGLGVCFDGRSYGFTTGDMYFPDSVAVWKYDLSAYLLSIVTRSAGGQYPDGRCTDPVISGDGNVIVFFNGGTALTAAPMPEGLWAYNLTKRAYDRCDISTDGLAAAAWVDHHPCLSRDGRYVVFVTNASLAANDTNETMDVYLRDRVAKTTTLESVSSAGLQGTGEGDHIDCALSGDGKAIVFTSQAKGLTAENAGPMHCLYLRRVTPSGGTTTLVSRTSFGDPASAWYPSISADGRKVAFCTPASGLVSADNSGNWDVFVVDVVTDHLWWASAPISDSTAPLGDSTTGWGCPSLSGDGRYVVFQTNSYGIVSRTPVSNTSRQMVMKDLVSRNRTLLSTPGASVYGDDDSGPGAISANGDRVAFISSAANLVGGDTNNAPDVFACRTSYAIYGKARTAAGLPLPNTSLLAVNRNTQAERWTYSQPDGSYCLTGLAAGDYNLWAYRAGYQFQPASHTLTLNALTPNLDFVGRGAKGDGVVNYRALLIGISKYSGGVTSLQWADQDALDMRCALLTGANWKSNNIKLLLNAAATAEGIKQAVSELMASCDADDVCFIWFAGHGSQKTDLYPFDETDGLDETLVASDSKDIYDDDFGHWINRCGTSHYFIGLDCCHSGGQVVSLEPTSAASAAADWPSGFFGDFLGITPETKDLNDNGTGAVLAACAPEEVSRESGRMRNGVFSHVVLLGSENRVADTNKDNWITPAEMMAYAKQRTIDAVGQDQHPMQFLAAGVGSLHVIGAKATPDLRISQGLDNLGENIFSSNGVHQDLSSTVAPGTNVTWKITLVNESAAAHQVKIKGSAGNKSFPLRYHDVDGSNADITTGVTGTGWLSPSLAANGVRHLTITTKATVTPLAQLKAQLITATFADDTNRSDTVSIALATEKASAAPALALTGLTAVATSAGAEISFHLQSAAQVQVRLLNLAGRPVRTLAPEGQLAAGTQRIIWDGRAAGGTLAPRGTYLVEVTARTGAGLLTQTLTSLRR